jgi:hypothetical protein
LLHCILQRPCTAFCSAPEILFCGLKVVLLRNEGRITDPGADDVQGVNTSQLRFPAGSQVVEKLWPWRQPGAADNLREPGPKVLLAILLAGNDADSTRLSLLECLFKVRP